MEAIKPIPVRKRAWGWAATVVLACAITTGSAILAISQTHAVIIIYDHLTPPATIDAGELLIMIILDLICAVLFTSTLIAAVAPAVIAILRRDLLSILIIAFSLTITVVAVLILQKSYFATFDAVDRFNARQHTGPHY